MCLRQPSDNQVQKRKRKKQIPLHKRVWSCLPEVQAIVINIQCQVLEGQKMVNTTWLCLLSLGDAFSSCFSCWQNASWAVPDCYASTLLHTFASSTLCQVWLLLSCPSVGTMVQFCPRAVTDTWAGPGLCMQGTCRERTRPRGVLSIRSCPAQAQPASPVNFWTHPAGSNLALLFLLHDED